MKKLTERQNQILSFIRVYTAKTGEAPTIREIGDAFGMRSTNGVSNHLKAIEAKGRLKRLGFIPRGIKVLDNLNIRFCGVVS
ncbi:MAG: LexA family transcriptional regulator [Planctomycetes bacterium]|nr:LexA family transcriptional regulator [Planctomycetota bacterium]MCH9727704.1 LexA family transcriptional regulator [Planctomycetota bacterium]MCH9776971.1 LexA family transcriptional regulator [Planctomycetota bacterium]